MYLEHLCLTYFIPYFFREIPVFEKQLNASHIPARATGVSWPFVFWNENSIYRGRKHEILK